MKTPNGANRRDPGRELNLMRKGRFLIVFWPVLYALLFMFSSLGYPATLSGEEVNQDTVEQKRSGWMYLPIIFYTPETKMAGGSAVSYFFRESGSEITSRPSTIMPTLIYTQKKQIMSELAADLYWKDETYHLKGYISYIKFPDKFYGIGNNTSEDDEEDYTPENVLLLLNFQLKIRQGLYLGVQYEFEDSKIKEVEEDGLLVAKDILGSEGGRVSGAGILINWDTRNNIYYPSSGSFHQLSSILFSNVLGSDYDFNSYNLDSRKYFPLFSSHVLAFQGYINIITGDPPFQMLSLLGGQNLMRGYYTGRYRDKNMIAFQVEHRFPVWWRFGMVGFVGVGDVADKIRNFERRNFKPSVGLGIRYLFNRKEMMNLRLDFGYGKDTAGFYITFLEAF